MLFESWYFQIIGLTLQSIALVALGTALIKEKIKLPRVLTAGLIIAVIGFITYQLPLRFGMQVPIGLITCILVLHLKFNISILKSAVASLVSFIILIVTESITVLLQFKLLDITEEMIVAGPDHIKFLAAFPSLLIFLIISGLVYFLYDKSERKS